MGEARLIVISQGHVSDAARRGHKRGRGRLWVSDCGHAEVGGDNRTAVASGSVGPPGHSTGHNG